MTKNKKKTHFVDADRLPPVQAALLPAPAALLGARAHAEDDVSGLPVGALVALGLEDDLVALGRAEGHVERELRGVFEDLAARTRGALPDDDAAAPAARVARHLRLRVHAGEDLLLDDARAAPAALVARVDVAVGGGAGAAAVVAQYALLDHELCVGETFFSDVRWEGKEGKGMAHIDAGTFVHVFQRDLEFRDGRGPAAHLLLLLDCIQHNVSDTYG